MQTPEEVEALVQADSWSGKHEHVPDGHGDSFDFFIPKWVLWTVVGVGLGVVAWAFWKSLREKDSHELRQGAHDRIHEDRRIEFVDENVVASMNDREPVKPDETLPDKVL